MRKDSTHPPLVSVLMTVYNREKYLAEAIESVLASTYHYWELIIVDDGSKDNSVRIAQAFAKHDQRISVYCNENNLGDYPNRNQAASYAKGKYLKYVDADDLIYPYGLEQLVFYMEQFPDAGYGLCSLPQDQTRIFPFQLNPEEAYHRHYLEHDLFYKAPLSSIIKKDAFKAAGKFTGKRMLGDFEFWNILSRNFPVVLMPHGIVWSRDHEEQEMADHRKDPMFAFQLLLLAEKLLQHQNCPLNATDKKLALKKNKQQQASAILSATKNNSLKKGKELLSSSDLNWFQTLNYRFKS
jgi:glycosyltransferase involved in cell wall biosynthesis